MKILICKNHYKHLHHARWGEELYKTFGGTRFEPWDGTKDGEELPVGTYYYIIDLANQDEPITGPVTIIR